MNNIPKGYKLVPVKPTKKMLEVGHEAYRNSSFDEALVIYCTMIDSAPTPPQPIYDEAKERELFVAWANEAYGVAEDEELNMKNPAIKENLNGWLACAQSRAKAVEVGHE